MLARSGLFVYGVMEPLLRESVRFAAARLHMDMGSACVLKGSILLRNGPRFGNAPCREFLQVHWLRWTFGSYRLRCPSFS